MNIAIPLHVLSVVIWVGGMFFAYMALRPVAASLLEPPQRLALWVGVFGRFFPWVWLCVPLILVTGVWMMFSVYGGFTGVALHVHLMFGLGIVMMLIFGYVYFSPYQALKQAVTARNWPQGGAALGRIRQLIGVNTLLGVANVLIASGGMYWLQ